MKAQNTMELLTLAVTAKYRLLSYARKELT
jgi:hypothetical protein